MENEMTEEGYKIEVLKARISALVVQYEDTIATYEVTLQQARQRIEQLQSQVGAKEPGDEA